MILDLTVAGVGEVVGAFGRGVGAEQFADGGDDRLEVSRRRLAQQMLELGEDLLNRVEVGRVLGEKEQLWTCPGKAESSSEGKRSVSWASRSDGSERNLKPKPFGWLR